MAEGTGAVAGNPMPTTDARDVWELYLSPMWLPTILAADELGILSSIADMPGSTSELTVRLNLNGRALGAVLALLASLGYLAVHGGTYHVTDSTRHHLLSSSPYYWGGVWASMRARGNPAFERLREKLVTPDPVGEIPQSAGTGHNIDGWAAGSMSAAQASDMVAYMHSHSVAAAVGVAHSGLFSDTVRLLDVGGCSGVFSIALARQYPKLTSTIMDLPAVCCITPSYVAEAGLQHRVSTHAADMFREDWPLGHDAILMSNMFHDWRRETCLGLARRAFGALPSGGSINLHEILIADDGSGPRAAAAFSVMMVIGTEGQQFTFTQLAELLCEAGFADIECFRSSQLYSVIRGIKP